MKNRIRRIVSFSLILLVPEMGHPYTTNDFPNYFSEIKDAEKSSKLVEEALLSILRRIQVPHVDGVTASGQPKIVTDGFFSKVEKKVREQDPGARVYVSGGVVRSLLGYIYKKLHNAHQRTPPENTELVLKRIIQGEKRKGGDKSEILALSALGIGSDLDILVDPSKQGKDHEATLIEDVTKFINSAEEAAGLRNVRSKLKYAVVPIGDVKDYQQQIDRASTEGGSNLDWLAFQISPASGNRMRMPESHPDIFRKFLAGVYDYTPPSDPSTARDTEKQTIRGLRPLLEIPFLSLSEAGGAQLSVELKQILSKIEAGGSLSRGAIEQFEKMIRNARFEGAHNRFLPGAEGQKPEQTIESLVHRISLKAPKGEKSLPIVPEFIINRDPRKRIASQDPCALHEKNLLMNPNEFINDSTDKGVLYHGTPYIENALSMIRNGLIVSSKQQGLAVYGRGVYASNDPKHAAGFGSLVEFKIKNGFSPRVFNFQHVAGRPELQKIEEEAKSQGMDLF